MILRGVSGVLIMRCLIIATLLMLLGGGTVSADTGSGVSTPQPGGVIQQLPAEPPATTAPVPPVSAEPTEIPIATAVPPAEQPSPDTGPVSVVGETPTHQVTTVPPTVAAPSPGTSPSSSAPSGATSTSTSSSTTTTSPGVTLDPQAATQPGVTLDTGSTTASITTLATSTGDPAASTPMQLSCGRNLYPDAEPFLVSPFNGWTTINSFVDHDYPDYATDGTMVLANGLTARATEGQSSDFFPAYWSTSLRQYVNYDGHNGYDFGISYQPVLAAASGTVMFSGWNGPSESDGYGQMILINHHNGYVTLYGHLSTLEVRKGDHVTAGEEIGISGSTGHSSGPHLHFSVFHNCNVTDPYGWTGSGHDPLRSFDGETAGYLWLPGHDPLILNPPPNWPAFPAGLHLKLPAVDTRSRSLPPVDRLLLLSLPDPSPSTGLTAGPALARTESAITQEAEVLSPYLDDLRARGLISAYQVIPAASAVWVRGTADSATLEALPGVASLSGVSPADVTAAQAGLAHSVLIQLGKQQAPALWPVGFRSALHPWRPLVTAVTGHALVAGYALPGQKVTVSVQRDGRAPGVAETIADPQSGGFVAMLHDADGNPVSVRHGDTVEVQSGGKQATVTIARFALHAHVHSLSGRTAPRSSVPITLIPADGGPVQQIMSSADSTGRFRLHLPSTLQAGSLAIASSVDGGGDQEAAAAYAPGMLVDLSTSTVTGWLTDHNPTLQVWRHGREFYSKPLNLAPDGSFRLPLQRHSTPVTLRAGDDVSIGSAWHRYHAVVPRLGLTLDSGSSVLHLLGPARAGISVSWNRRAAGWTRLVTTDQVGQASAPIQGPRIGIGDSATALLRATNGDGFMTSQRVRGVVIHDSTARVTGQTAAGTSVRIRLLGDNGHVIGTASGHSNPLTGAFSARLLDKHNHPARVQAGFVVAITDMSGTVRVRVPQIQTTVSQTGRLQVDIPDAKMASLTWTSKSGDTAQRRLRLDAAGLATTTLGHATREATLSVAGPGSIQFEHTIRLRPAGHHSRT